MADLRHCRGLTVMLVVGSPVRPQFTIGKPWCYFRVAIGPVAFSVPPSDMENITREFAKTLPDATPTPPEGQ